MNDFDLHNARARYGRGDTPNRLALVMVVDNLREWANDNSDGWAYWPKPTRAAAKAMELIDTRDPVDITNGQMQTAVIPIRAFLTRQHVGGAELILRAVTA